MTSTIPQARPGDPETSHDAAGMVSPVHQRISWTLVMSLFKRWGSMTDTDLAKVYRQAQADGSITVRQSPSGLRTRRKELVNQGKLRDSGLRQKLPSGRKSIIWEVVDA